MEYRPLDITVISAEDLKDVNLISKMDVYVVVSLPNDPKSTRQTPVDKDGGKSPKWNHRISLSLPTSSLSSLSLLFNIISKRPLGNRPIGHITLPLSQLLDSDSDSHSAAADDGSERVVEYQVKTPSGKPKGTLKFSYKFGESFTVDPAEAVKSKNVDEPVTAYPAHPAAYAPPPPGVGYAPPPPGMAAPYAYPPPAPGYGYAPPPPPGYGGYPPPQPGYGYPPAAAGYGYGPPQGMGAMPPQQGKKKKKGSKLGLGLGAGLLGGLLVGDMISDVGEMAAYDAGFDDSADFEF
ncbi:hypothetical protein HYC85_004803 [Camellia sinensis]|uniref:C2 domain-containing protein n=1 Tax=Camellia sinensis TaxID=4442 RepID=A0A7J7I0E6_CAMSI|nr:hypothetical protein HYC85_004803 [Camellia sinensis]